MSAGLSGKKTGQSFRRFQPDSLRHAVAVEFARVLLALLFIRAVNQQNVTEFILAGAVAVGVGGHLIPKKAIQLRQPHRLHELASRFLSAVNVARGMVSK